MSGFAPDALTEDALLGGRVRLLQPKAGYRAATDPVLLAAAAHPRAGETVLDAGCGAGAAMLCLAARIPGLALHGIEHQPDYAALARLNAERNGAAATIWDGDLFAPPAGLRRIGFDWVLSNPPFFAPDAPGAPDPGRDAARRAARSAADWAAAALARLRSGGRIALIHRAEALPALLSGLGGGAGEIRVTPLAARAGRAAKRVILTARKGAKAPFTLAAPLILHQGEAHLEDRDDFSGEAAAILRDGAAICLNDVR